MGIGDPERGETARLKAFHEFCFVVGLMIMTGKVQQTMDDKVRGVIAKAGAFIARLRRAGFKGDRDVARRAGAWKGEHVGRLVHPAKLPIEAAQRRVIGEEQRRAGAEARFGGARRRKAAQGEVVRIAERFGPPPVLNDDVNCRKLFRGRQRRTFASLHLCVASAALRGVPCVIGVDNAPDKRMADDVSRGEPRNRYAFNAGQELHGVGEA